MSAHNQSLSRRWFQEVWNDRSAAAIEELLSPEGVGHMETGDLRGVEAFREVRDQFLSALPDLKFEVESVVSDGDDVVVRWSASGTHTGDGLGVGPTHQKVDVRGMTWHRFKDGVMVEGWDSWNQEAMMRRLRESPEESSAQALKRKRELAARIRELREELFGENGGPELARRLGLPARTWYNYETGVTVPAEVILNLIDLTDASPRWLLCGEGPRHKPAQGDPGLSPIELIRQGLEALERDARGEGGGPGASPPV